MKYTDNDLTMSSVDYRKCAARIIQDWTYECDGRLVVYGGQYGSEMLIKDFSRDISFITDQYGDSKNEWWVEHLSKEIGETDCYLLAMLGYYVFHIAQEIAIEGLNDNVILVEEEYNENNPYMEDFELEEIKKGEC
jgi:hypothetical protein